MSTNFVSWLTDTLLNLDKEFDTESLVPYINDILKAEENDDERTEAISYMLGENLVSIKYQFPTKTGIENVYIFNI